MHTKQLSLEYLTCTMSVVLVLLVYCITLPVCKGQEWQAADTNIADLSLYCSEALSLDASVFLASEDGVYRSTNGRLWVGPTGLRPISCGLAFCLHENHLLVLTNDRIYASTNGIDWSIAGRIPVYYPNLRDHIAVSFLGDLWVMTGIYSDYNYYEFEGDDAPEAVFFFRDVLQYTSDRAVTRTPSVPWAPRAAAVSLVFQDKLWLIGGVTSQEEPLEWDSEYCYLSDVWWTADGETWVEATDNAPWGPRAHHACVVFQNKLWLLGGFDGQSTHNDVWVTSDGTNWTCETEQAPWPPRASHGATAFKGGLWVIAGVDGQGMPAEPGSPEGCYGGFWNLETLSDVWVYTPEPGEGEGEREGETGTHSADQDGDGHFSLTELLRVIQLYNAGAFHCDSATEDGYAPGADATAQACVPHSSDYNPQDWHIDLNELLRAVQFYNTGGYTYCPESGTEDGFCPGGSGL